MASIDRFAKEAMQTGFVDDNLSEKISRTIVLDVDLKHAEKSFESVDKKIDSLTQKVKSLDIGSEVGQRMAKNLEMYMDVALATIYSKLTKAEKQYQDAMSNAFQVMQNDDLSSGFEKQRQKIEKEVQSSLALINEYTRQAQAIIGHEGQGVRPNIVASAK